MIGRTRAKVKTDNRLNEAIAIIERQLEHSEKQLEIEDAMNGDEYSHDSIIHWVGCKVTCEILLTQIRALK